MMVENLFGKTAIVGIGATEFSKRSGRSELRLAVEVVLAALEDAGIEIDELDGISTFTMDNNSETEVFRAIGGRELKFFARTHFGGGQGCGSVLHAAMAVATGVSKVCVVYRAMNERSEQRFGLPHSIALPSAENALFAYHRLHGLSTPAAMMAMQIRRYMYETGAGPEDFATIAVAARKHAANNPNAFFYNKPLSRDEYMNSRMICDPLRLYDCCQESDGGVALVIVGIDRAQKLKNRPAVIRGAAQASPESMMLQTNYYKHDTTPYDEVALLGRQLYAAAELSPRQMQAAIIYDHFGPSVMPALEGLGFCRKGEAKEFIKAGNIEIGGSLPVNTHGGQVGEAYIHGLNGISEGVRQIRRTAVNQVPNLQNIVVTSGNGVPTSGLILSTD